VSLQNRLKRSTTEFAKQLNISAKAEKKEGILFLPIKRIEFF
jgi:hypothetical protein